MLGKKTNGRIFLYHLHNKEARHRRYFLISFAKFFRATFL